MRIIHPVPATPPPVEIEWQEGDVAGGNPDVQNRYRVYYRRNEHGTWIPFPHEGHAPMSDDQMTRYLRIGQMVLWPPSEQKKFDEIKERLG